MTKFFDRLDNILDGKTKPTITDRIIMALMIPTTLLTIISMVWLAAAVAELYR